MSVMPENLLEVLEPEQLSTYRHASLGRMPISRPVLVSLWTLRLYLLFMAGLMVLKALYS